MNPCQPLDAEASGSFEQVLATYLDHPLTGSAAYRISTIAANTRYALELQEFFEAQDSVSRIANTLSQIANPLPFPQAVSSGERFGNYELLRELGRGGMGVVYLARDMRLDREVALKVIGSQGMSSPSEIWRFRNEVDAISQLSHPSLVPIFDYGEHRGQFFFTMKHIDGESLEAWKATHVPRMHSVGTKRIHERTVAGLVRDIARGIHHAHQRGVLHRDLKPANILLERDGHPVVVDFGLAKQMQKDMAMTQTGALIGTPAYMAPELIPHSEYGVRGKSVTTPMTTAVDVYGLGAILYVLLSGKAPFEGQSLFEVLSQVREQEVRSLCAMNPLVDRGLDAICGKCLEKAPVNRYESAEALASDLECWLDGMPIAARTLPLREKVVRWCYRHKLLVSLLMLVSASILFGIGALTIGLQVATDARDSAIKQRQDALKNLRVVIQEINDLENRRPDLDEMRLDLLTRIQEQLRPMLNDSVHGSLADETSFWLEVDAGDVQENRGHFEAARAHFERAMRIAERIPSDPKGTQRRIYSFALSHMGDLESTRARFAQAIAYFQECLRVREDIVATYPSTQSSADLALAKVKLATSMLSLEFEIGSEDLIQEALRQARDAIAIFQTLVQLEPNNVWHVRFRGVAREVIADGLSRSKNWQGGMEECRLGLEELESAAERMPEYRLILEWHSCFLVDLLSVQSWWCGHFERGEQAGMQTLQIRRRIFEFNPQAVQMHYLQSRSWDRIGQNQQGAGKFRDAVRSLQEAVRIVEEVRGLRPDPSSILREEIFCLEHLIFAAVAYQEFDALTLASIDKLLTRLVEIHGDRDIAAPQASQILDLLVDKFQLLVLQGQRDEASRVLAEAHRFAETTPSIRDEVRHVSNLAEQSKLLDGVGEPALILMEKRISQGMMLRLQSHFADSNDALGLATVSERLALSANTCITKLLSAKGMAKARGLDPTGVGIRYQPNFERMLEGLRSYGDVAEHWIRELNGN